MKPKSLPTALAVVMAVFSCHQAASQASVDLPDLIPVTPEASSLIRSIQFPINYAHGSVDITIPLYEITVGDVVIPISLTYNHKGVRPFDYTYLLGQGWSLRAEPSVYRRVNGKPDDDFKYVQTNGLDKNLLKDIKSIHTEKDAYPDEYYYSIPGKSGSFFFKYPAPTSGVALLPYEPVSVKLNGTNFIITDDDGTIFNFEEKEYTDILIGNTLTKRVPTGWKCTSIVNPKGTIRFTYTDRFTQAAFLSEYQVVEEDIYSQVTTNLPYIQKYYDPFRTVPNFEIFGLQKNSDSNYSFSDRGQFTDGGMPLLKTYDLDTKVLTGISFPEGSITFEMDVNGKTINNIRVKDTGNNLIKLVTLTHDYIMIGDGYPVLTLVEVKDSNSVLDESYSLNYYTGTSIHSPTFPSPPFKQGARRSQPTNPLSSPINFWGYWTNTHRSDYYYLGVHEGYVQVNLRGDFNNLPTFKTDYHFWLGNANRMAEPTVNGTLKSITTKSGSITEFEYESDKFLMDKQTGPNPSNVWKDYTFNTGGLRIHKIKQSDHTSGSITVREIKYGNINSNRQETGLGVLCIKQITPGYYITSKEIIRGSKTTKQSIVGASLKGEVSFAGAPVVYQRVTEYIKGIENGEEQIFGKSVYHYNYNIVSDYMHPNYNVPIPDKQRDWSKGKLELHEVYEYDPGTKQYSKIQSTGYKYEQFGYQELPVGQVHTVSTTYRDNNPNDDGVDVLTYIPHAIKAGALRLKTQADTLFTANGNVISETTYAYNLNQPYPSTTTVKRSNGTEQVTRIKYTEDATGITAAEHVNAITAMKNKNILRAVIEQTEVFNSTEERTIQNAYTTLTSKTPSGWPVINTVSVKEKTTAPEQRIVYHKYDSMGNPVYATKDNLTNVVYIWGYGRHHLVAIVENATEAQVQAALGESPATVAITAANVDSKIALLRNNATLKANAHITSFKYKPLVGIIEITDPRGVKTTYDYDANGRLKTIKDAQGNKVSEYIYNIRNN